MSNRVPFRCKFWPRGCKHTEARWGAIKKHEKNCRYDGQGKSGNVRFLGRNM